MEVRGRLHSKAALCMGKSPGYSQNKRHWWPTCFSAPFGEEQISCPCRESNPFSPPIRSLIAISTALFLGSMWILLHTFSDLLRIYNKFIRFWLLFLQINKIPLIIIIITLLHDCFQLKTCRIVRKVLTDQWMRSAWSVTRTLWKAVNPLWRRKQFASGT
jgi:hypothetical protein